MSRVGKPPEPRHADSGFATPDGDLASCIRAYYWHDLRGCRDLTLEQRQTYVPPAPYSGLLWLLGGRALLTECGGAATSSRLPTISLVGAHRCAYRSMAITPYDSFGVVFQPGALALMSGLDMSDRADRISDARAELPPDWRPFLTALADADGHFQRIALCEGFVAGRWEKIGSRNPAWIHLIRDVWQRRAIAAAIAELNWTNRHFQRRTRVLTGLRPVEIERMLRLERALLDVRDGRASRVEAASAHGYADQPHFTREVRAFYQRTPGELMRRLADPEADGDWLLRM